MNLIEGRFSAGFAAIATASNAASNSPSAVMDDPRLKERKERQSSNKGNILCKMLGINLEMWRVWKPKAAALASNFHLSSLVSFGQLEKLFILNLFHIKEAGNSKAFLISRPYFLATWILGLWEALNRLSERIRGITCITWPLISRFFFYLRPPLNWERTTATERNNLVG